MTSAAFSHDRYRGLAERLADALLAQGAGAVFGAAEPLKVSVYKNDTELPFREVSPSTAPIAGVFGSAGALLEAVRRADPAAVEVGLSVLGQLAPEEAADIGAALIDLGPWPELAERAAAALSLSAREAPFVRLLDAVVAGARGGFFLRQTRFAGGCAHAVERLTASPVLRYDPVEIPAEAAWAKMSEAERAAVEERLSSGGSRFSSDAVSVTEYILAYLGEQRCTDARPLVEKLYREHPSKKIRLSAGHALIAYGDEESLSLLMSLVDQHDEWRRWFGVKAAIVKDPSTAVERLGGDALLEEPSRARVGAAFDLLGRDVRDKAQKKVSGEPWLLADRRWLGVLARWSKERKPPGRAAADLLVYFPREEVDAALQPPARGKAAAKKPAARKVKGAEGQTGALAAFQAGQGEEAWRRLVALGDRVRDEAHIEEAREVARLTMVRARENFQIIADRLRQAGYQFRHPKHVFVPPPANVVARVDELEAIVGTLPIALRAAFEHLGAWLLNGDHPAWPKSANVEIRPAAGEGDVWFTDPLMVSPVGPILDDTEGWGQRGAFSVDFAGDPLLKAGFSGGSYSILVPQLAADAPIDGERRRRTLVEHLRMCLRYGGFAGFEDIPDRPQALIDTLTAGLPPI